MTLKNLRTNQKQPKNTKTDQYDVFVVYLAV